MRFKNEEEYRGVAGVYRIVCYATGDAYVGSTTDLLARYYSHMAAAGTKNQFLYKRIAEVGIENFQFEVVDAYSFDCRNVMLAFERALIAAFKPSLNVNGLPAEGKVNRHPVKHGFYLSEEEIQVVQKVADIRKANWFCQSANITPYEFKKMQRSGAGTQDAVAKASKFIKYSVRLQKMLKSISAMPQSLTSAA